MTSGGAPPPPSKLSPSPSVQPAPSLPLPANTSSAHERARRHSAHPSHALQRPTAAPRNSQALRRQHKSRPPRLQDEDSMAETTAIRSANSRKGQTSITHLMKFALPPRPLENNHGSSTRRTYHQTPVHWRLDKERYRPSSATACSANIRRHVQANYRFVVDPRTSLYSGQVDERVEWGSVLQVLASEQHQSTSCPICLCPPAAARMAKCGHIFCLPCLIRYMHTSNESKSAGDRRSRWSKCPLCWDVIYLSDTRSIRWIREQVDPPHEGSDVVLRLMIRRPGQSLALPRDAADALEEDSPWSHAAEVLDFARVMKGDPKYMAAQLDREAEELLMREQEDEVEYGEGRHWTQKAILVIDESRHWLQEMHGNYANSIDESSGEQTSIAPASNASRFGTARRSMSHSSTAPGQIPYFFYQLLPNYYLSPLDIRILQAAFGNYASFPTTILPRVEKVSMGHVVDDDMRRRAKYLAHLPLGCEVSFLECDMTDIVPMGILERFAHELEGRRRRNREKQAKEEKERVKAEKEDSRQWLTSRLRRETLQRSTDDDSAISADFDSALSLDAPLDGIGEEKLFPATGPQREGSVFAMLASPSSSPDAHRTCWGTPAVPSASPQAQAADVIQPVSEEDGWLRGWEEGLMDNALPMPQADITSVVPTNEKVASSKRRKGKKITLMSTNARRAA